MKCTVTGGKGFIGSKLVESLIQKKFEVSIFDIKDGMDICNIEQVENCIKNSDVVIHLAAYADPAKCIEQPVESVKINVLGTSIIAQICLKYNIKLIYCSTAHVYGNQNFYPISEDAIPNPVGLYANTKFAAENIIKGFINHGLNCVIVRFPGVYGSGIRDSMMISQFIRKSLKNDILYVHNDGKQLKTPIYIDDLISGIILIVENFKFSEIINLGTNNEISVMDIAKYIQNVVGKGKIENIFKSSNELTREYINSNKAYNLFKWQANTSIYEGISKTIQWLISLNKEEDK